MRQFFKEEDGWLAIVDCSDWMDFKQKIHQLTFSVEGNDERKFLFRGQGCSSWGVVSSFDRKFPEMSPAELDALYLKRMNLFRKNFETYGSLSRHSREIRLPTGDDQSELTLEAMAQHHGLSTRLVDWSSSLYVASFFALSGASNSSTGMVSIWALDRNSFNFFSTDHLEYLQDFYEQNERNLWQMGSFSRNRTTVQNLEDLFRLSSKHCNITDEDEPKLYRFDVPIGSEAEALSDLAMMRISSMTIFPGIEGVVKWIEDGC